MGKMLRSALYHRVVVGYAAVFIIGAIATSLAGAMTGLVEWDDLTSLQWFVLSMAVIGNVANVIGAFLNNAAQKLRRGEDLLASGDTAHFVLQAPQLPAKGAPIDQTDK